PVVAALADLDVIFVVLLAYDRREQRLFRHVMALGDTGPVAIDQAGQKDLVEALDDLAVEHRPKGLVFEVGGHSGKWARHSVATPRGPEIRRGRAPAGFWGTAVAPSSLPCRERESKRILDHCSVLLEWCIIPPPRVKRQQGRSQSLTLPGYTEAW